MGEFREVVEGGAKGEQSWIVFAKNGFYTVNQLSPKQAFLGYMVSNHELMSSESEKFLREETAFSMFVDTFSKTIGHERICELLIECLCEGKPQVTLNSQLKNMIKDELKGGACIDYRDWNYDLNLNTECCPVAVSPSILQ